MSPDCKNFIFFSAVFSLKGISFKPCVYELNDGVCTQDKCAMAYGEAAQKELASAERTKRRTKSAPSCDDALFLGEDSNGSPLAEGSVTGPSSSSPTPPIGLQQHDYVSSDFDSLCFPTHLLRHFLPVAITVFVACYGLFSAGDFADPSSKYGLPIRIIGGVESNPVHFARFEKFFDCDNSGVLSFHDLRSLVVGLESGAIPKFKVDMLELTATCFGRCPLRKIHTGVSGQGT